MDIPLSQFMLTSEVFSDSGMIVLLNVLNKCSRCLPCCIALGSESIRLWLVAQIDFVKVNDDLQRRVSNETMEKCWFVKNFKSVQNARLGRVGSTKLKYTHK